MSKPDLVIAGPDEFLAQGWTIEPPTTLLDDPAFVQMEEKLTRLVELVPRLRDRPPRPYQKRYAALAALRTNNLLAHEAGTGKSYEAGLLIMGIYTAIKGDQVRLLPENLAPGTIQIVAPKHTLKSVWLRKELAKLGFVELSPDGKEVIGGYAEVIDGERAARRSTKPIWIYHFDLLKKETERGRKRKKAGGRGEKLYKVFRKHFAPGLMVIDEVHRLRLGTERTAAMRELRKKAKRVTGLTGTPMDGWVAHLASILEIVYRKETPEFPFTANRFTQRFTRVEVTTRDFVTGEDDRKGPKRRPAPGIATDQLPAFFGATQHLIHRLTFKDQEVSPHVKFPAMDHRVLTLPGDPAHMAYYRRVNQEMLSKINEAIKALDEGKTSRTKARHSVLSHLNTLRAASSHPWGIEPTLTDTVKLRKAVEIAKWFQEQNRKIIFFTNRIAVGNRLQAMMEAAGVLSIRVYDQDDNARPKKLNQDERDERIEAFQETEAITSLVGNAILLCEGLTLVEASGVCHVDHDWMAYVWRQANHRVVRPGQEHDPVPTWDLRIEGTVDCYVHAAMLNKDLATIQAIDRQFESTQSATIDPLDVARTLLNEEHHAADSASSRLQ